MDRLERRKERKRAGELVQFSGGHPAAVARLRSGLEEWYGRARAVIVVRPSMRGHMVRRGITLSPTRYLMGIREER